MSSFNTIAALKGGDEYIFEEVFKEYRNKIYYYILSKARSTYMAEEVTQLAFIKLWKNRLALDESVPLSAQIFQIAKTTSIDFLRKEQNLAKLKVVKTQSPASANTTIEDIDSKELRTKFSQEVQNMPPVRKVVFELSRNESKTYREIAQLLSLSEKTVENHISLALKQLRRVLPLIILFIFSGKNF